MSSQPMDEGSNIERMDEGLNIERMDEDLGNLERDSGTSSKKRFSTVYNYFTLDDTQWQCKFCE